MQFYKIIVTTSGSLTPTVLKDWKNSTDVERFTSGTVSKKYLVIYMKLNVIVFNVLKEVSGFAGTYPNIFWEKLNLISTVST